MFLKCALYIFESLHFNVLAFFHISGSFHLGWLVVGVLDSGTRTQFTRSVEGSASITYLYRYIYIYIPVSQLDQNIPRLVKPRLNSYGLRPSRKTDAANNYNISKHQISYHRAYSCPNTRNITSDEESTSHP